MQNKKKGAIYYAGKFQPFAKARVSDGPIVFVSGSSGRIVDRPGEPYSPEKGHVRTPDIGLQTWDALDKIKNALEEVGSSLENLLGLLQFVRADNNLGDGQRVVEARVEYFRKNAPSLVENPPTTTMVSVPSLYYSDMKVEILAWGYISNKKSKAKKRR